MSDRQTNVNLSYKISSYVDFFDSYFKSLVPWEDKDRYFAFLLRFYIANGSVRGAIARIAALLVRDVSLVGPSNKTALREFEKISEQLNITEVATNIVTSMFIYPRIVAAYLPREDIECTCPRCGARTNISKAYKGTFQILEPTGFRKDKEKQALRKNTAASRANIVPASQLEIQYICGECQRQVRAIPKITTAKETPGVIKILEPSYTVIVTNDAGYEYVQFEPTSYDGPITIGSDLLYDDIKGIPWVMVTAYATNGSTPARISEHYYQVFRYESVVAPKKPVDVPPILSLLDDLMSVSVLKRGNEAVASSKVDPLYILSPVTAPQTSKAAVFSMTNENIYKEFILEQTRAHAEGDLGRIVYSPVPVRADSLYGDGRRFLTMNEVMAFTNNAIGALGVNPNILAGGSGLSGDPITLEILQRTQDKLAKKFISLLTHTIKLVNTGSLNKFLVEGGRLSMDKITTMPGSYNSQVYANLVEKQVAPISRMLREVGLPGDVDDAVRSVNAENMAIYKAQVDFANQRARFDREEANRQSELQSQRGQMDMTEASNQIEKVAMSIVQQELPNMSDGERKSYFDRLSKQNTALYHTVLGLWEDYREELARQQQQQQQ